MRRQRAAKPPSLIEWRSHDRTIAASPLTNSVFPAKIKNPLAPSVMKQSKLEANATTGAKRGKTRVSHDWFWFYFLLVEKVSRDFLSRVRILKFNIDRIDLKKKQ